MFAAKVFTDAFKLSIALKLPESFRLSGSYGVLITNNE